jgi:hypothetical protein
MGHDAKQMGRPKCDDDHNSEKADVHVSVIRRLEEVGQQGKLIARSQYNT